MQVERYSRKRGRAQPYVGTPRAHISRHAALKRRRRGRITRGQRGFVRTTGFYGRFAGAGAEMKFHDVDVDVSPIATAGDIGATLLTIPEGNGEEERIGRSITIKKIMWRFSITKSSQATLANTSDVVRLFMIQDKQCNGVQGTVLGLLETASFLSFNQLANSKRFRVLMDRTYDLSNPSGSGQNAADAFGEIVLSDTFFKDVTIPIEYDNSATTGVITSVRSNNIFIIAISQDARCVLVSKVRLRYSDR